MDCNREHVGCSTTALEYRCEVSLAIESLSIVDMNLLWNHMKHNLIIIFILVDFGLNFPLKVNVGGTH